MSVHHGSRTLHHLMGEDETGGVQELRALLRETLGEKAELLEERMIWRSRVYRARFRVGDETPSFILKRLPPDRAFREQLVLRQWLPRLGLANHGSPLVGVAAAADGATVWHVYDDLGNSTLDRIVEPEASAGHGGTLTPTAREATLAAVELVAQMHMAFAQCGFLGECRQYGIDLGVSFLSAGLTDAMNALEAGRSRFPGHGAESLLPLERLLGRLRVLRSEEPERTRLLQEHGGVETLLHGDLWTCNVVVQPVDSSRSAATARLDAAGSPTGMHATPHVRLIDWDHAGVGFVSYDLSAFLLRFPLEQRAWVLDAYEEAVFQARWKLPERPVLNALFDTAERARLVSSVLWPALAYRDSGAAWALEQLAEVERWFEALGPVLPQP